MPFSVAPHTGAWIEIICIWKPVVQASVAPHTGAWIEIFFQAVSAHEN